MGANDSGTGSLAPYKVPYQTVTLPSGLEIAQTELNRNFQEVMRRAQDAKRIEVGNAQMDNFTYPTFSTTQVQLVGGVLSSNGFRLRSANTRLRIRYGYSCFCGGGAPIRTTFQFTRPDGTVTGFFDGFNWFINPAGQHTGTTGIINIGNLSTGVTFSLAAAGPVGNWIIRPYITLQGATVTTDGNDYFWLTVSEEFDTDNDPYIT